MRNQSQLSRAINIPTPDNPRQAKTIWNFENWYLNFFGYDQWYLNFLFNVSKASIKAWSVFWAQIVKLPHGLMSGWGEGGSKTWIIDGWKPWSIKVFLLLPYCKLTLTNYKSWWLLQEILNNILILDNVLYVL